MVDLADADHCPAHPAKVRRFARRAAGSRAVDAALDAWYAAVRRAAWKDPADVKAEYRSPSILKNRRAVFNICGNRHRLVVKVNYVVGIVYIRFIGSHSAYDAIDANEV